MELNDLEVYRLARDLAREVWAIYSPLPWQDKKIVGDQFIKAIDSVGANIAEGWGRFHFPDRNKFNYNARGSLVEGRHWLEVLIERGMIAEDRESSLKLRIDTLHAKLNGFINSMKPTAKSPERKQQLTTND